MSTLRMRTLIFFFFPSAGLMIGIFSAKYQEKEGEEEEVTPTFIEGAERCARLLKAEGWGESESPGVPSWSWDPCPASGAVYAIYPVLTVK